MCEECEYCGRPACSTDELRMAADPHRGGAVYPCCHDCFCDGHSCDDCDWRDLKTMDEFTADESEAWIAAMDDKAHARAERRAGW